MKAWKSLTITVLSGLALFSPKASHAALIIPTVQQPIKQAVQICDTQSAAVLSGAYRYVTIPAVVESLKQIKSLAESTRPWLLNITAVGNLQTLSNHIDSEINEATSGRWNYYTLTTTLGLMQQLKGELGKLQSTSTGY